MSGPELVLLAVPVCIIVLAVALASIVGDSAAGNPGRYLSELTPDELDQKLRELGVEPPERTPEERDGWRPASDPAAAADGWMEREAD